MPLSITVIPDGFKGHPGWSWEDEAQAQSRGGSGGTSYAGAGLKSH